MKKIYPYIFPAIALILVIFLTWRWYRLRTQRGGEITPLAEGVEIENLSQEEMDKILKGTNDFNTANLAGNNDYTGQVRYEIKDGRVIFTVNAYLPVLEEGAYQVWVKSANSEKISKAFILEYEKAGYIGSASVAAENLPLEIIISKEMQIYDEVMEEQMLKGVINK